MTYQETGQTQPYTMQLTSKLKTDMLHKYVSIHVLVYISYP